RPRRRRPLLGRGLRARGPAGGALPMVTVSSQPGPAALVRRLLDRNLLLAAYGPFVPIPPR
ncbi:MAG: hypothetical protein K8I02_08525, partial [Candidatus Methylomirabilis sp.]|nr:hypothetical protein [Deltaproteobacteria bacterium]